MRWDPGSTNVPPGYTVKNLEKVLEKANLMRYFEYARIWCHEAGITSLEDLPSDYVNRFATDLEMRDQEFYALRKWFLKRDRDREMREMEEKRRRDQRVREELELQNLSSKQMFGPPDNPYIIHEELGSGATATVHKCSLKFDPKKQFFAAKVISLKTLILSPGYRRQYKQLEREAKILASLRNDYVTSLHKVIEQNGNLYLVMELVQLQFFVEFLYFSI